ncbi:hypothetical protein L596_023559 [Steinernema carpocapsae]|uniref:Uncharacterized protein n=1 Tax=Steinernema carpocapsae TaxID=34508 RepID=A0A4U5ME90_STECR|nr:hypothetical protein L596_023559 [Steinernema carpocapsae]
MLMTAKNWNFQRLSRLTQSTSNCLKCDLPVLQDRIASSEPCAVLQHRVEVVLDPILVLRDVPVRGDVEDEAGEIGEAVDELEKVHNVVLDLGLLGIGLAEVLFEDLADGFEALTNGFVVGPGSGVELLCGLDEEDGVLGHS